MQQQQPSSIRLLSALGEAMRQPDLRAKLLFTAGILIVFRFMANIPIPGADLDRLNEVFQDDQLLGFLNVFSGGALRRLSIVAMGVYPYITASIIMQLLVPVIPRLQAVAKEGEYGRQKINQYTHWLTIPLALAQGYGQLRLLQSLGAVDNIGFSGGNLVPTIAILLTLTAGTMFLVWMGELITERGIGNGISVIIFGGIVASLPSMIQGLFSQEGITSSLILLVVITVLVVYLIVVVTEGHRRVPVQYGRSLFRGGRMYRQAGASYIPLRVNAAGMIPLIFAFSLMIFPPTIASYFTSSDTAWLASFARSLRDLFSTTGSLYWVLTFFLVVLFTFFYSFVTFQQQQMAENLQKNGGFIPGIRPGKPTDVYLTKVVLRLTVAGALFLGFVALLPYFATKVTDVQGITLSAASLLIVVGVALDTMRQLESQLLMRRYEGFIG